MGRLSRDGDSARGEGALPLGREARTDRTPTSPPLDVAVPEVRAPYSDLTTLLNRIGLIGLKQQQQQHPGPPFPLSCANPLLLETCRAAVYNSANTNAYLPMNLQRSSFQ